ncbi:hypothetical protein SAMN04488109_1753 [Chryseolinea serpens]|uniref:Uncharacterized protein n=1 Tax=Chryseolinea serpens TaxID=947013 RepID=A0A1M5MIA3_9BACT|nr:hypothetical protein SAMN04488109_1753 [Chryseolinea serpens]
MDTFCDQVITAIKAAENEGELIKVISYSMSRLRLVKNSNHEFSYIISIILSLRNTDLTNLSLQTRHNIKLAIAIFGQFQKEKSEHIS